MNMTFSAFVEPGGEIQLEGTHVLSFVECDSDLGRITLSSSEGKIWFERAVSFHTPEIKSINPFNGSKVGQNLQSIKWTKTDEDGDALWNTVLIKKSEDTSWTCLAIKNQHSSLDFDPAKFGAGDYILQMKTTDGVNTGVELVAFSITGGQDWFIGFPFGKIGFALTLIVILIIAILIIAFLVRFARRK